ncbi:MAG: hypothetical protein JO368_00160, partial [Acidimicrobiales bacterium]|nr:hypothetical protein [Acidimicrobiales bacterium]
MIGAGTEEGRSAEDAAAYTALRRSAATTTVARDVLRVSGPDAESYLQGQLSQDVAALAEGAVGESLLLSPQGRIDAYLRVGRLGPSEFVLDVEAGYADAVVARLQRFLLRTKVELERLDWVCVGLRGPQARAAIGTGAVLEAAADWPGLTGVDLLGPRPSGHGVPFVADGVPECPPGPWEAARIESGQPRQGREI